MLRNPQHPHRSPGLPSLAAVIVLALHCSFSSADTSTKPAATQPSTATSQTRPATTAPHTYSTKFPHAENALSESGQWITGSSKHDWAAAAVTAGIAHGTQSGHSGYDDTVALLAGPWPADQSAQATVHIVNPKDGNVYEEVELRLRSTLTAHSCTGYEINFRCTGPNSGYNEIVRWDGPLGKFTYLSQKSGGAADGDIIKATIVGDLITVYRNGKQVNQARDKTFPTGNPGIGFFLQGGPPALNPDFGFSAFSAQ